MPADYATMPLFTIVMGAMPVGVRTQRPISVSSRLSGFGHFRRPFAALVAAGYAITFVAATRLITVGWKADTSHLFSLRLPAVAGRTPPLRAESRFRVSPVRCRSFAVTRCLPPLPQCR